MLNLPGLNYVLSCQESQPAAPARVIRSRAPRSFVGQWKPKWKPAVTGLNLNSTLPGRLGFQIRRANSFLSGPFNLTCMVTSSVRSSDCPIRRHDMEKTELFRIHSMLHLIFHRNRNQHGKTKWWKWLSILKRSVWNLALTLGPSNKENTQPSVETCKRYLADYIVPRCYV